MLGESPKRSAIIGLTKALTLLPFVWWHPVVKGVSMTFKFGSGPGLAPTFPWPLVLRLAALWLLAFSVFILLLVGLKLAAHGGCSLPPPIPQDVRRDAICTLLDRGPDCHVHVEDTMAATIYSDELDYSVYIAGDFVGTFPIANGEPIDPSLLTRDLVNYSLQFQTGTPELQARFRLAHCKRVAFVDRVLEWTLGETKVLIACAS